MIIIARYNKIYATVDQIVNPDNSLLDINDEHYRVLENPFLNQKCKYMYYVMTVSFSADDNPDGMSYSSNIQKDDGNKFRKDGCYVVIHDGRSQRHSVELNRDWKIPLLVTEPLCTPWVIKIDGKPIFQPKR